MILNRTLAPMVTAGTYASWTDKPVIPHADVLTLSQAADSAQSVIGQAPTHVAAVPALAAAQVLLADGTYLTGSEFLAMFGLTAGGSGSATPAPAPPAAPTIIMIGIQ